MYQGYVDQVREETLELRVINASTLEGSSGTKSMALDVVLSAALTYDVSVTVATVRQYVGGRHIYHQNLTADTLASVQVSGGTAAPGVDYQAQSQTVRIPKGQTSGRFNVIVIGDTVRSLYCLLNTVSGPIDEARERTTLLCG